MAFYKDKEHQEPGIKNQEPGSKKDNHSLSASFYCWLLVIISCIFLVIL